MGDCAHVQLSDFDLDYCVNLLVQGYIRLTRLQLATGAQSCVTSAEFDFKLELEADIKPKVLWSRVNIINDV
jgi:hypothetical protein